MNYIASHLSVPFDVVLNSGAELDQLFARYQRGELHIIVLYAKHEGFNGRYRIVGSETDGSAQPTPRSKTAKKAEQLVKSSTFSRKQLKLWD